MIVLFAIAGIPLVVAGAIAGWRRPVDVLLPAYALFVPFGSGLSILSGTNATYGSPSTIILVVLLPALAWQAYTSSSGADPMDATAVPDAARVPSTELTWVFLAIVAGLTGIWSIDPARTLTAFIALTAVASLPLLLRLVPVTRLQVQRVEGALIVGGLAVGGYGLVLGLTGQLSAAADAGVRFGSDLTDPNHIAAALLLPLAICLNRALRRSLGHVLLYQAASIVLTIAILLTGSRGGTLAAILVILIIIVMAGARTAIILSAVTVLVVLTIALVPAFLPDRLATEGSSGRTALWRIGAVACLEHCLVGSGWNTYGEVYEGLEPSVWTVPVSRAGVQVQPHNNFLLVGVEAGLLGAAMLGLAMFFSFRDAIRLPRSLRSPPVAAFVGLAFTGMLLSNLEFKYFWMTVAYISLLSQQQAYERLAESAASPAPPTEEPVHVTHS